MTLSIRLLAGVSELVAGGGLFAQQLLGQIVEFILGEAHGGGVVAEHGLGGALNALAQAVEVLGRAVLQGAGLVGKTVAQQLRAAAQGVLGVCLALLAEQIVELLVQARLGGFAVDGNLAQLLH